MGQNDATRRQIKAARPDRSTWLSANAGSGKTKVLTDRVARLLLEGVNPQNILCLTYTKAAASEMQNRLFDRLGKWAMKPNEELRQQLEDLGAGDVITDEALAQARRLFASAIETPGGLKIQTIHSFCSAVLRRFPFEAGITPNFTEMEERAAALLRAEIVEEIGRGEDARALEALATHFRGADLTELTDEIARMGVVAFDSFDPDTLRRELGLPDDLTADSLLRRTFEAGDADLLSQVTDLLAQGSANDVKAANKLRAIQQLDQSALSILEGVFLYGKDAKAGPFSAKLGSFPTKGTQAKMPALMPALEALMLRVEATRDMRLGLASLDKTQALVSFARLFLTRYEQAKQARGWLDFDDLILRARDLLADSKVADWVLYKLDGGIDHILVDEAQDTSPVQWQVIECLAREFTSGEGTKADMIRTIFVVGDKKQSIYSFQGADPREFDRMKAEFGTRLKNTGDPLQDLQMEFSFRTASCILQLVDTVFADSDKIGFQPQQTHISFKSKMPGRVDLWPVRDKPAAPEDPEWYDPVDIQAADDPNTVLAQDIAGFIKETLGTSLPDETGEKARPVQPGDFLILVRRRSPLFHNIIRECKARELPVAGADRLKVGAELAVKDLQALLSFLATPEDDLSLAVALRSPLFGWSEADLFALAHDRTARYLWAELRDRRDEFAETMAVLDDLRDQVDFLRPYDLLNRILTRHDGRRNLLGRLGVEAEDGIDALLGQAMAYEQNAVDSLTGFLVWMESDDLEIKRQLDSAGNRIRVMTVHGAKGLESPIVILPDTAMWRGRGGDDLAQLGDSVLWRSSREDAARAQVAHDARVSEEQEAERDRLLYVAMTRAEQWLICAAAGDIGTAGDTWHDKMRHGLERLGAEDHEGGLRLENGNWSAVVTDQVEDQTKVGATLPAFFQQPAETPEREALTLSPSDLGGAKALPDERGLDEEAALRRGRQIHRLLEVLPDVAEDQRPAVAKRLLSLGPDKAEDEELSLLLAEVEKVITKPALSHIFAPEALVEVPISATLPELGNRRIHGIIDRLVVTDTHVLAVDFKTNALAPQLVADCPDGLLRQMGAYGAALQQVYPGRDIQTALLWTRTASLMHLPHDLVTGALANTHIP